MTNRIFRVLIYSEGAVKVREPFGVPFQDYDGRTGQVACGNWEENGASGAPAHRGLIVNVDIQATDIDSALQGATNVSEALLVSLSLQSLGATGQSKPEIVFDASLGILDRDFLQVFAPDVHGGPVKVAQTDIALRLLESVQSIEKKGWRDRVVRAGMNLRRGLDTADDLSRFGEYWTGLECLNPLLQERLTIEPASWACECGREYVKDEARGVKAFIVKLCGETAFAEIKRLRRDVFHGVERLPDVQERVKVLSSTLEAALQKAVLFCLGEKWEDIAKLQVRPLHGYGHPWVRLRATLTGENAEELGLPGLHPHYQLRTEVLSRCRDGDIARETVKHVFKPRLSCPARVKAVQFVTPFGWSVTPREISEVAQDETSPVDFEVQPPTSP